MELFYRTLGSGPPLIILHGLFGSSDNWLNIAKQLGHTHTIFLPDQRNHGQSPHDPTFSYPSMAEDLHGLVLQQRLTRPTVMGHSMGGKVGMFYAQLFPDALEKLVVVDIGPKAYPTHHQDILSGMRSLDLKLIQSRKEADQQLAPYVADIGVRQFLLKNLSRDEDGRFSWKLNLEVIHEQIEQVGIALPFGNPCMNPTLFIRGGQSNYILDDDQPEIEKYFAHSQLATIPAAGHWVHAQAPDQFLSLLQDFLDQPAETDD